MYNVRLKDLNELAAVLKIKKNPATYRKIFAQFSFSFLLENNFREDIRFFPLELFDYDHRTIEAIRKY